MENIMPTDQEPIKIICGDCLEVMKGIPDKSVDLIVTSPPYNQCLTTQDIKMKLYSDNMSDEEYVSMLRSFFKEAYRILKDDGSFFYNYKTDVYENKLNTAYAHLMKVNNLFLISAEIVWKYAGNFDSARCRFPTDYEMIFHLTKSNKYKFFDLNQTLSSVWNIPHVMAGTNEKNECKTHPCPYPIKLIRKIIQHTTNENDLIIDPFLGAGTTAVVCKQLKRKCIGIEIIPEYINITKQRLAQEVLSF